MLEWRTVIDRFVFFHIAREGDGCALSGQCERLFASRRCHEVQRAQLIVLAPPAPIRQFRHPTLEILGITQSGRACGILCVGPFGQTKRCQGDKVEVILHAMTICMTMAKLCFHSAYSIRTTCASLLLYQAEPHSIT